MLCLGCRTDPILHFDSYREEHRVKYEEERQEREAAMCQEVAIKKAIEMVKKRTQEDTEEKQAEAVNKIQAAKETAR